MAAADSRGITLSERQDDEVGVYEVRVAILASADQASKFAEEIGRRLSPDPSSSAPDEMPWTISIVPVTADEYPELIVQGEIEGRLNL